MSNWSTVCSTASVVVESQAEDQLPVRTQLLFTTRASHTMYSMDMKLSCLLH
jgi:hypothetical protein